MQEQETFLFIKWNLELHAPTGGKPDLNFHLIQEIWLSKP